MSDTAIKPGLDYDPRRGGWIPWAFVGAFVVIIAVNLVLVYAALSTFTGVTTAHAYDTGRAYNAVLAEAARQDALGWRGRTTLEGRMLAVQVADREGLPVGGRVEGVLTRPLDGREVPLSFTAAGPGRHVAPTGELGRGQWEARVTVTGPAGERFDIRDRVIVP